MRNFSLFSLLALLLVMNPAQAHKVIASAWADGDAIEGEVGFSNGEMATAGTVVEVLNAEGDKLGETVTNEEGLFRFTPTLAIPHVFQADLGMGHVASVRVEMDELPLALSQSVTPAEIAETVSVESSTPVAVAHSPELQTMIAEAVQHEIKPLRKEIAAYKEKNNLQNILGGLGYICGIFGLIFFIYGRRDRRGQS